MHQDSIKSIENKVAFRAAAAVAIVVVLLGSIAVVLLRLSALSSIESQLDEENRVFQQWILDRAQANLYLATTSALSPALIDLIRQQDRAGMILALGPVFSELKARYSVDNLHFHTPAGVTILRMHQPGNFGDALAHRRPMIADVNRTRGVAVGLEWGVNGLVVRGMRAIVTPEGEHIGSVEVGSFITDRLLESFEPTGARIALFSVRSTLVDEDPGTGLVRIASLRREERIDLDPADLKVMDGMPGPIGERRLAGGVVFVRTFPLVDYSGRTIGLVQIGVENADLVRLRILILLAFPLLALLGIGTTYLLALSLGRTVTWPLLSMAAGSQRLADGDLQTPIDYQKRPDEIGFMARTLDSFRSAMILARRKELLLQHRGRMEALRDMTGRMAHELNNLLQPIRLSVEVLKEDPRATPLSSQLAVIDRAVDRARRLVLDILAFARPGAATLSPAESPSADLDAAMSRALTLIRASMTAGQTIIEPQEWPRVRVRCDEMGLCQVVLNICRNGFDAMGGRGPMELDAALVEITAARSRSAILPVGIYARIDLADHGPGVPPEIVDRLFEPFFTTKPTGQGTGLGLAIAYGMVREWGGDLALEAATAGGARFVIYLPVVDGTVCSVAG